MLRLLATLAFVASFDILLFGGSHITAADRLAVQIFQHF
jgi:predicted phosphodiesterase